MQPSLMYHNLDHTVRVVGHVSELATYYDLKTEKQFILATAAWFHDTGHLFGEMEEHEIYSAELMSQFLQNRVPSYVEEMIRQCIMATKMPVHPTNILEEIICDADTWHLGTDDFMQLDENVWLEMEARKGKVYTNKTEMSLRFLKQHTFYTTYCIDHLSEGKQQNIEYLESLNSKFI
ncbi:HD domain-containing protein [Chitinophaga sp.]|uniref:HD domain-containing protein n=1 Tax=Chitinophaga sp. TaxID=1869181 RepID=UPI0031DE7A9A